MTDNLEEAGATVDKVAAEVKPVAQDVAAHAESFGEWTKEKLEALKTWVETELAKL